MVLVRRYGLNWNEYIRTRKYEQAKRVIRGAMQGYLLLCNPEDPQGDGR